MTECQEVTLSQPPSLRLLFDFHSPFVIENTELVMKMISVFKEQQRQLLIRFCSVITSHGTLQLK